MPRSLVPLLVVIWGTLVSAGEPLRYGGIEIGAKGIKAVALSIDEAGNPDLAGVIQKMPHKAVNNVTLADRGPDGEFRPEALDEARAAVADFHKHLAVDLKIPPDRLWVVASSGLTTKGRPRNFDDLKKAVAEATGGTEQLKEIDQQTEVELLIRGAIPPSHWKDSVLLDVGSGNAKVGYFEPKSGLNVERVQVVSTKIEGTVAFTKSIEAELAKRGQNGFAAFRSLAAELRKGLSIKVKGEIGRRPGLVNRPRVFLSGGATWAIATLTDPEGMAGDDLYVRVPMEKLRDFHRKLAEAGEIARPDLAGLPEEFRDKAARELDAVLNTFTAENLLAGTEIVIGFADALEWERSKKEVFFTKSGVLAWIVGYVQQERSRAR